MIWPVVAPRTGGVEPGAGVVRWKPQRGEFGRVTAPARVRLIPSDSSETVPVAADACLPVRAPARIGCALPERFDDVRAGERIVLLQSGDKVSADLRLMDCRDLPTDESALTGESLVTAPRQASFHGAARLWRLPGEDAILVTVNERLDNDVIHRWRGGQTLRGIARDLGVGRKRVARVTRLHQQSRAVGTRSPELPRAKQRRASQLDEFANAIQQLLARYPDITAVRLREELQEIGYAGGYTILQQRITERWDRDGNRPGAYPHPLVAFDTEGAPLPHCTDPCRVN